MWMLRDNQSSLIAQIEIFIYEPLDEGEKSAICSKAQAASLNIFYRASSKLNGS